MTGRLGIVAGAGGLPRRLVESCRAAGRDVFVLALEGAADAETVRDVPHAWCRIGAAANGLALLRENNVGELVLAGGIRRPSLDEVFLALTGQVLEEEEEPKGRKARGA